jgi:hypothetical protein
MSVGINKLEMKRNKEQLEWMRKLEESGKSKEQVDAAIEEKTVGELRELNKTFSNVSKRMYTELEITEEIKARTRDMDVKDERIEEVIKQTMSKKLRYYEIHKLNISNDGKTMTFGLTHEYFDVVQFREEVVPYFSTVYVTVAIQINSPYALVFVNGRADLFAKTRKLIRQLISSEFQIKNITWDSEALKEIEKQYAKETKGINAKNVEGKITETARASNLRNTNAKNALYQGDVYMISFNFAKLFPGNDISINGRGGWITTTLSDKDIQDFVKTHLLTYSSL